MESNGRKAERQMGVYRREAVHTVAEAINAVYNEMSIERRVKVKQKKDSTPHIDLTNEDLRLLGLARRKP